MSLANWVIRLVTHDDDVYAMELRDFLVTTLTTTMRILYIYCTYFYWTLDAKMK